MAEVEPPFRTKYQRDYRQENLHMQDPSDQQLITKLMTMSIDNNRGSTQPFQAPTVQVVEFERVGPTETEYKRPPGAARTRSTSSVNKNKRNHSESITSLGSTGSMEDEDTMYFPKVPEESEVSEKSDHIKPYGSGPKSKHMDHVDLERQIILTAGGRRENVNGFLCKLLILVLAVMGCAVLVFYAL